MRAASAETLLNLPVRAGDIELGRSADVILDPSTHRILGLDVLCGDGSHRYVPLAAASVRPGWIEIASPLHMLDLDETSFYRREATTLRTARDQESDEA